jgi:mRNA interferase MazF
MVKGKGIYIPERGDMVCLQFNPQAGHEQAGRRPALVISPRAYNEKVGLALMCPVSSKRKGYPFEVSLPDGLKVSGVILADQIKCLDWKARRAEFACKAPAEVIAETLAKVRTVLE